jgi:hypothetical protein
MADQARVEMVVETLNVVADRGYYDSQEILRLFTPAPNIASKIMIGR